MRQLMQLALICASLLTSPASAKEAFRKANELYSQGKYRGTIEELNRLKDDRQNAGFISYWKGMSYNRLQEFPLAERHFKKALSLGYNPQDLHYELGQALFASENLIEAKIHFSESFKRSFKRATSLYYMAFISKEMGEIENARSLFDSVRKLPDADGVEARQAAHMQLADIEFEAAEKKPDVFRRMKSDVIPLYEDAYDVNPDSPLAPRIKEKITQIQKKYELILFQLQNGRPAQVPPYFLRIAQEFGLDTNVTFAPAETTIAKARQASGFSKTEAMGRYTFYYKNFLSFSPELRANNTYYFNRVPEIHRNDNYLIAPALRTSFEHSLFNNPASLLVDYEFNEARRDVNAREKLEFSSRSHALMIGERFKIFSKGETVIRLRQRQFESFIPASDSSTTSVVFEQILGFEKHTFLFLGSLDRTRVKSDVFDTDAAMLRIDWLLPKFRDWFNPSIGMGLIVTDPINDRDARGIETNLNPSLRLSRSLGKNWRVNTRFEHQRNNSKDKKNFAYKKNIGALEFEYLF